MPGGAPGELVAQTSMVVEIPKNREASTTLYASIDNIRAQLATTATRARAQGSSFSDVQAAVDSVEDRFAFLADSLTQQKPGAF